MTDSDPVGEATVYVVDDEPAMRKSLRWLFETVGLRVELYESAQAFLESYRPGSPGCLVLDVRMPGMSGLELQENLSAHGIDLPVVIITAYADVAMAVRAMKTGAVEFIEKPVSDQVLLDHIHHALELDRKHRTSLAEHQAIAQRVNSLTKREYEVMELVVQGLSSRAIADQLGVSFKTVEAHRAKIMKKMHANSVPHLIRMRLSLPSETP